MSRQDGESNKDRALGRIGFQFLINGKSQWATGEYETFVREGESADDAMARAEENALQIAFDIRDAFVSKQQKVVRHYE